MTASPTPRTQLPPRLLPVLYFGAAHVALALAFAAVAIDPRGVSGFFYHSRMLGDRPPGDARLDHRVDPRLAVPRRSDRAARVDSGHVARLHRVRPRPHRHRRHGGALLASGVRRHGVVGHHGRHRHHRRRRSGRSATAAGGAAARRQCAHRPGVSQRRRRGDPGRADRVRQGLSLPAGVRARQRLRARPPRGARLGDDDGRRRRVSAAADGSAGGDAQADRVCGSARSFCKRA